MKKNFLLLGAILLLFSGCSKTAEELKTMSIGLMPSMDGLPILVALEKGYMAEEGLEVEAKIFQNGKDRDTELNTGAIDGTITDILGLITLNNAGHNVVATSTTDTVMTIIVDGDYKELKEFKVGTMEISVTNYLLSEWTSKNLDSSVKEEKALVEAIPQRVEFVQQGTIDAAVLPEPMGAKAESIGLTKNIIEIEDEYTPNIMMFNKDYVVNNENELKAFYRAYNKAVDYINNNNGEARDILVSSMSLDVTVKEYITIPVYSKAKLFDQAYFDKMDTWCAENIDIKSDKSYDEIVTAVYLP